MKEESRRHVETIWRRLRNTIRVSDRVDAVSKSILGLSPPKRSTQQLKCPHEPPDLRFARALHQSASATPMHELRFNALDYRKSKPEGAVRLELFIDLIGIDEPVPEHPGENYGGRPWYIGSWPKSPIVLAPPMPRVPMILLYWGRWAGSGACDVGPFCKTVVSPMVGGMKRFLGPQMDPKHLPMPLRDDTGESSERRDVTIRVAVLEMQRAMFQSPHRVDARQLEAPASRRSMQLERPEVENASEAA